MDKSEKKSVSLTGYNPVYTSTSSSDGDKRFEYGNSGKNIAVPVRGEYTTKIS